MKLSILRIDIICRAGLYLWGHFILCPRNSSVGGDYGPQRKASSLERLIAGTRFYRRNPKIPLLAKCSSCVLIIGRNSTAWTLRTIDPELSARSAKPFVA